jgi:hypothetical protein
MFLLCAVILVSAGLVAAQDVQKRAMTTDDALNMVNIGNELMSPDGNWVFYSESTLNWEKNKRDSKYYMVPAGGGEAFQYIGEGGGRRGRRQFLRVFA